MTVNTNYIKITKGTFEKILGEKDQATVLVFGAAWSGNSEIMNSIASRVSAEFSPDVKFFKVDIEKDIEVSTFFGVHNVPTTIMLKDGEIIDVTRGLLSASKLRVKVKDKLI